MVKDLLMILVTLCLGGGASLFSNPPVWIWNSTQCSYRWWWWSFTQHKPFGTYYVPRSLGVYYVPTTWVHSRITLSLLLSCLLFSGRDRQASEPLMQKIKTRMVYVQVTWEHLGRAPTLALGSEKLPLKVSSKGTGARINLRAHARGCVCVVGRMWTWGKQAPA